MTTYHEIRAALSPDGPFMGVLAHSVERDITPQPGNDLTYHNGPVFGGPVTVNNVYLDTFASWDQADFDAFTAALVASTYYRDPTGVIGQAGTFGGSRQVASGLSGTVNDVAIYNLIDSLITAGTLPRPVGSIPTVYQVLLPPTLQVLLGGVSATCVALCGWHTLTPGGHYVNILADTSCFDCHGTFTDAQAIMIIASHEYVEWRSDPTGLGWWNNVNGFEMADFCNFVGVPWGPQLQWTVTEYWQNGYACWAPVDSPPIVPALPNLYASPTMQIRDHNIVVRTRSLLEAGHEPVPVELLRDLFKAEWMATDAAPIPSIEVLDDVEEGALELGDWIVVSQPDTQREQQEGYRYEYADTTQSLEIEYYSAVDRQRLYDLMAETRRIVYKWFAAFIPYDKVEWDGFTLDHEPGPWKYHGTGRITLRQWSLPVLTRYHAGQEYPALVPNVTPQKVLP